MNTNLCIKISALTVCLFATSFNGIAQQIIKPDTSHYTTIRIDPAQASGGNANDVFDEVNYIPLETTEESLFGSISQLEVTGDRYIIKDNNTKCILFFDKKGKFIAKITSRHNGPTDHLQDFDIDRFKKQISFTDDRGKSITYANFDGKVLQNRLRNRSEENPEHVFDVFHLTPSTTVWFDGYIQVKDDSKDLKPYTRSFIKFANNGKLSAYAMPYSKEEADGASESGTIGSGIGPLTYFGNDTTLFFSEPSAKGIYKISPGGIKLAYKFVFPIYATLPADLMTNPAYRIKPSDVFVWQFHYFSLHPDLIYNINNVYQTGNNLLFEATSHASNKEDNLIYNVKSGSLIAYKHISPDEWNSYLPVYDALGVNFSNNGFTACDGKYFYTDISSLSMFKNKEEHKDKNIKYNATLANYFATQNRKSNPVLVQLKLKDQL